MYIFVYNKYSFLASNVEQKLHLPGAQVFHASYYNNNRYI